MINIVTWFDGQKSSKELTTACAGNGIRIVADDFESVQDFFEKFEALDANVDVLVVGNGNIEKTDKTSFFADVRVTEPNLRIVIVFPGYRNQYIEEQITEYKVLGITEIIYEGQRLDEAYFAEVMKKGYIYDYNVNVYNEPGEVRKPLSPAPKCVTIGVIRRWYLQHTKHR